MKNLLRKLSSVLYLSVLAIAATQIAKADVVTNASLTFNLDGDAFANGADVNAINAFAQTLNPAFSYNAAQPFLEFAGHNANAPAGRPAAAPTTFNDLRSNWSRPSSTGLNYNFNNSPALQTFNFDASNVSTVGGSGSTRFFGGDTFWYGSDSVITPIAGVPASVWLQYGNLDIQFDASRQVGGNSGWFFENNLAGVLPLYDTRNVLVTSVAAGANPGSLIITGDLYTAPEFATGFGMLPGINVGTFSFNAVTAVPEPGSTAAIASATAIGAGVRWRRRKKVVEVDLKG